MRIKKGVSALWYSKLSLTNSVPDQQSLYPDGQHTLAFYIKCVPTVGLRVLSVEKRLLGGLSHRMGRSDVHLLAVVVV